MPWPSPRSCAARGAQRRAKASRACVVSHARNMAEASSHGGDGFLARPRADVPRFRVPEGFGVLERTRLRRGPSSRRRPARVPSARRHIGAARAFPAVTNARSLTRVFPGESSRRAFVPRAAVRARVAASARKYHDETGASSESPSCGIDGGAGGARDVAHDEIHRVVHVFVHVGRAFWSAFLNVEGVSVFVSENVAGRIERFLNVVFVVSARHGGGEHGGERLARLSRDAGRAQERLDQTRMRAQPAQRPQPRGGRAPAPAPPRRRAVGGATRRRRRGADVRRERCSGARGTKTPRQNARPASRAPRERRATTRRVDASSRRAYPSGRRRRFRPNGFVEASISSASSRAGRVRPRSRARCRWRGASPAPVDARLLLRSPESAPESARGVRAKTRSSRSSRGAPPARARARRRSPDLPVGARVGLERETQILRHHRAPHRRGHRRDRGGQASPRRVRKRFRVTHPGPSRAAATSALLRSFARSTRS